MSSCLDVLTLLSGLVVLALAGWAWRGRAGEPDRTTSAYGAIILFAVAVFMLIHGAALLFRPVDRTFLQWLEMLLVVALACIAGRMTRRPNVNVDPDPLLDLSTARAVAAGILRRADFQQIDFDLIVGRVDEFDAIRRGFGVDAACAIEEAFARTMRKFAPPDALVWRASSGDVVVLGHLTDAVQQELATAATEALADDLNMQRVGVRPRVRCSRATTAEFGYSLADLEAAAVSVTP